MGFGAQVEQFVQGMVWRALRGQVTSRLGYRHQAAQHHPRQGCHRLRRGRRRGELLGRTDREVLPAAVADLFASNEAQVRLRGGPVECEEVLPGGADGPRVFFSVKFPLRRADGTIVATCGISTDITRRRQAEAALLELNESLERRIAERTAAAEVAALVADGGNVVRRDYSVASWSDPPPGNRLALIQIALCLAAFAACVLHVRLRFRNARALAAAAEPLPGSPP